MSPILLRPIREQFEHNRVIRLLQVRLRRRYAVGVNLGDEPEATGVRSGTGLVYPDLVLTTTDGARRVHGIVEVETGESVNNLEAMAEWVHFARVRGAFYLYVPAGATDVARRLCEEHGVAVTEIWSYHAVGDQMRFTMTYRSTRAASRAAAAIARAANGGTPAQKRAKSGAAAARRPTKTAKRTAKPAKRAVKKKTAKRATKTAKRATKSAKRTAKTSKHAAGRRPTRSAAKRTRKGAKRR